MIGFILIKALELLNLLVFARVIISWLPIDHYNPIVRFIYNTTEPFLGPIRNLVSRSSVGRGMFIDFSPIILLLLIQYLVIPFISNVLRF